MPSTYDLTTDTGKVRLLLNDVADPFVFTDDEIAAFLDMEGGVVKRAAALAIQTNGSNELLASKVLTSQDISTHGESISAQMLEHARELRKQADVEADGYFELVDGAGSCYSWGPELTERLIVWP